MKETAVLSLLILLAGCATETIYHSNDLMDEAREFSVVSVTSPDFSPEKGQSISWFSPIIWASEAAQPDQEITLEIMGFIEEELKIKGYVLSQDATAADYVVGAAIADGNSDLSKELQHFFSMFPSIGESHSQHAKTTFYVGIINSGDLESITAPGGSEKVLWRSSIQAYILGDDVSHEFRDQRLRVFTAKLMRSLP